DRAADRRMDDGQGAGGPDARRGTGRRGACARSGRGSGRTGERSAEEISAIPQIAGARGSGFPLPLFHSRPATAGASGLFTIPVIDKWLWPTLLNNQLKDKR